MADKYAHLRPKRPRRCFTRDQMPKVRMTREQAEIRAAVAGSDAYECEHCGWWHTGTIRRPRSLPDPGSEPPGLVADSPA